MKDFIMWKFPSLNFALKYLSFNFSGKFALHQFATLLLNNAKDSAIIFYMPQLIQSLRTETNNIVERYIIKKCKESNKVAHQFLWSLSVEEKSISHLIYFSGAVSKDEIFT
jgi:phosphatidylinositol 4-kinase